VNNYVSVEQNRFVWTAIVWKRWCWLREGIIDGFCVVDIEPSLRFMVSNIFNETVVVA
jgi:hypothetical protein